MKTVRVATTPPYEVRIGSGLLGAIDEATRGRSRRAVLSDQNVAQLFKGKLDGLDDVPWFELEPGEDSKRFCALERVIDFLIAAELDRKSVLIALGGGVVGDVGGLAAALFMRGIPYVQVPTTLLAQVDSSVGGKTAVNLAAGKNLAGVFHQPSLVLADTNTLKSLSVDEFRSGLGEVVKTAMLAGDDALAALERGATRIIARDPDVLAETVEMCVRTKAGIVARDPHEKGPRKLLNLGHTFAHAIEHDAGFGTVPHGMAVGIGLALALDVSRRTKRLVEPGLEARVIRLLEAFGMPATLADLCAIKDVTFELDSLVAAMRRDKKNVAGRTRLVLPVCPGQAVFDVDTDESMLLTTLESSLRAD